MLSLINTIVLMWVAIELKAPMWVAFLLIISLAYIATSFVFGFIQGIKKHKKD